MSTNVNSSSQDTIGISDISDYFLLNRINEIKEIVVDEQNYTHFTGLPLNYSQKDYEEDVKKLDAFIKLKVWAPLPGEQLSKEDKSELKKLRRRISNYKARDSSSIAIGDMQEIWRIRDFKKEEDFEIVYQWHYQKSLKNKFPDTSSFIHRQIKRVIKWLHWLEDNMPDWENINILPRYLVLLAQKLEIDTTKEVITEENRKPIREGKSDNGEEKIYTDFDQLFEYPELKTDCYKVLRDNNIIDDDNNFIKNKLKTSIVLWCNMIGNIGLIDWPNTNRTTVITKLLNDKFFGLELGKNVVNDGCQRATKKYSQCFKDNLPSKPKKQFT